MVFESENLTLNGTKAKMLVVYNIIERILCKELDSTGKSIYGSSLMTDACKDFGKFLCGLSKVFILNLIQFYLLNGSRTFLYD